MTKPKLIRITTVPLSLRVLLKGQHKYMSEKGFEVVGVTSPGVELKAVEIEEEIRTIPLEMTRTISPLKDMISLWRFYKLCKKEKPLIVHSHTPKAGKLIIPILIGITIMLIFEFKENLNIFQTTLMEIIS